MLRGELKAINAHIKKKRRKSQVKSRTKEEYHYQPHRNKKDYKGILTIIIFQEIRKPR